MHRDPGVYLDDIREALRKISAYTGGLTFDQFKSDDRTVDPVVRNLEIIGEAVKQLPDEIKQSHASVDWRKVAGLRDVLIHSYFSVDLNILWDILQNKLPGLQRAIDQTADA